jgi:hypothetical protein
MTPIKAVPLMQCKIFKLKSQCGNPSSHQEQLRRGEIHSRWKNILENGMPNSM